MTTTLDSWTATLERLRTFQSRLLLSVHGLTEHQLQERPAAGGWSILNVIAHLSDLELLTAARVRSVLATDRPALVALDQNAFVAQVHHRDRKADVLEEFWFLRRMNLRLLERLTDEELARVGVHPDYGPLSIREIVARVEAHEEKHLGQIERIKVALELPATTTPDVSEVTSGGPDNALQRDIGNGITTRTLWSDGLRRALLVDLPASSQWPGIDYHVPGPEEVYILSGDFDDGAAVYHAGTFLHHPAGSSHSPRTENGCSLLVFYPEG